MPRLDALAGLAALVLRDTGHDRKANFTITIHCPDAVIHKVNLNAILLQFARSLQCIHRVAGKSRQLTGHDQIKLTLPGVVHHLHKRGAFLHLCTGDALVNILRHYGPVRVAFCKVCIPFHLVSQCRDLLLMFG